MWFRTDSKLAVTLCALGMAVSLSFFGCGRSSGSQALPSATPSAKAAIPQPGLSPSPTIAEGAVSYEHYCKLCHGKDATGYAADNAPSLVSQSFLASASDDLIAAGIRMGRPGTAMAAYGKSRGGPLEEHEIFAIVSFLRSKGPKRLALLPVPPNGDPKHGAELFEKNCQTCHGTVTTRGNAVSLVNPELLEAATPAFLQYAIVNGRPPTPMQPFAGKLTPQEIGDVVAWLWSLKPAAPTPPVANPTVPDNLPIVINPKGGKPKFTLREDRFVAAEQVKKALEAKQRIVIIDARSPADWIQFHVPGAVSLPYHDQSGLSRVPKDGTWVVAYCACPHHASGEVVDALRALKYPNTAVMDEGILFWKDHGFPLAGEAVPKSGAFPSTPVGGNPTVISPISPPKPTPKP